MGELMSGLLGSSGSTTWRDVSVVAPSAFVLGQLLSWLYEATYSGLSYSRKFADALTMLTCISAGFSLIARQSILTGIGLMAVISVVRFRANVKAPNDLVYIMAASTFGLGCGLSAFEATFATFLAFAISVLALSRDSMASRRHFDGVLRLRARNAGFEPKALDAILDRHCVRAELLSSSEFAQGEVSEHSYQVKLGTTDERHALLSALRAVPTVEDVRLLLQEVNLEY